MNAEIWALATATPDFHVTREEAYVRMTQLFELAPGEKALYEKVLLRGPIRGRRFGMDRPEEALEADPDRLVERFLKHGSKLAAEAARDALAEAELTPDEVSAVVVNTCTGYLCPGLTSYVAEELGLPQHVKAFDLMGMGCGAALPNLETAAGLLAREREARVLSIALEVCSATMVMGPSADLVISNSIFADGAAAAVLGGNGARPLCRLIDFESALVPRHREELRYRTEGGRLRNVLSTRVPVVGARVVAGVAERLLARHGISRDEIDWWVVHPGGTAVLDRVCEGMGLARSQLRFSYDIFREYGNMSSPSVLFVLRRVFDEGSVRPGQRGLLLSFGAGFTAFGALMGF